MKSVEDPNIKRCNSSKPEDQPQEQEKDNIIDNTNSQKHSRDDQSVNDSINDRGDGDSEVVNKEDIQNLQISAPEEVKEHGKVENMPKMEGRQMTMMIGPLAAK